MDARLVAKGHIEILREMRSAAASVASCWTERIKLGEDLNWSPRDVLAIVKETIQLERLIRGEATERVEVGVVDLTKLSIDEIEQLRALEIKAGVVE
jgi:hypothetical protein